MLGRAKWCAATFSESFWLLIIPQRDAWAKHKDIEPVEAKWLYVETLMKVNNQSSTWRIVLTSSRCYENTLIKQWPAVLFKN